MLLGAVAILWSIIGFRLFDWYTWGEEDIEGYHILLTVGIIVLLFIFRCVLLAVG